MVFEVGVEAVLGGDGDEDEDEDVTGIVEEAEVVLPVVEAGPVEPVCVVLILPGEELDGDDVVNSEIVSVCITVKPPCIVVVIVVTITCRRCI